MGNAATETPNPARSRLHALPRCLGRLALTAAPMLAGAALASGPVTAADQSVQQAGEGATLEEIMVTARKRNERLQDIAETVTVFTAEDIEQAGIASLRDVAQLTPGMYFSGDWSPSVSTLSIRGVTNNPTADAPVAFVVDGVAYGNSYMMGQDLFEIEQIEVLKGPQGSLYGRNSIGGAINIVTRRPTNEWTGDVAATAGNGSLKRLRGAVYGPLVKDKLLVGLSASTEDFDGVIQNEFLRAPVDFKDGESARLRLLFTPTDSLTANFTYTHLDFRTGSTYWRADNVPANLQAAGIQTGIIQGDYLTVADFKADDYSATVDYRTSLGTWTGIVNHQKVTAPRTVDIDFIRLSLTEVLTSPDTAETTTAEARYASPDERPFRWTLGAFWQDQERVRAQNVFVNTNPNRDPAVKQLVLALRVPTDQPSELRSVFGQAEYDFTPKLSVSVGIRYDEDRREDKIALLAEKFTAATPKLTMSYKPSPAANLYAIYSEGYRSGGFNPTAVFGRVYQPEKLRNYELGFKTSQWNDRLSFNGSVYYQDYSQQQFYVFSTAAASQSLINSKKSRAQGLELEARLVPTPGLDLTAGFNVIDTKIVDFGTFRAFAGITEADINGNELLYMPKYTAQVAAQYAWSIGGLEAIARADFAARGRIYWGFDNVESQGPTQVVNGRFSIGDDKWTITLFADNLLDEQYDTFCFVGRFIGNANRINPCASAAPRQYGAEVRWRF